MGLGEGHLSGNTVQRNRGRKGMLIDFPHLAGLALPLISPAPCMDSFSCSNG